MINKVNKKICNCPNFLLSVAAIHPNCDLRYCGLFVKNVISQWLLDNPSNNSAYLQKN